MTRRCAAGLSRPPKKNITVFCGTIGRPRNGGPPPLSPGGTSPQHQRRRDEGRSADDDAQHAAGAPMERRAPVVEPRLENAAFAGLTGIVHLDSVAAAIREARVRPALRGDQLAPTEQRL